MSAESPFVLARAVVTTVEEVSPSFVRVTFGGEDLADVGTRGPVLDQRIKLIFPSPGAALPELTLDAEWYQSWLALPEESRGSMRTYSIRELSEGELVIDFVLHLDPGFSGPASLWASQASLGDEILILGPHREHTEGGGIEYAPGDARTILLAGDETAAPAIARILEDSDPATRGVAFIEVPRPDDVLPIAAPEGVEVRWLPRSGASHGTSLLPAVLDYLGAEAVTTIDESASEDLLWETPTLSGLGEEIAAPDQRPDRYFWIAGESGVVTTLRRHLVRDLGIDRAQVAFMGYWRKGVAMRGSARAPRGRMAGMGFTRAQLESFRDATVPPLVGPDVRLLFAGINPGLWAAATQTHFAFPGNRFYPALKAAGIIDGMPDFATGFTDADRAAFIARGLGITSLVHRATARADELSAAELIAGAERLTVEVEAWAPAVVAIVGIGAYRTGFGRPKAVSGLQPERIAGAELWVVPNPSGLNAHDTVETLAAAYSAPARAAGII